MTIAPLLKEGKAVIKAASTGKITRKMPVFYNPAMTLNRDLSVLLLQARSRKDLRIADPLAASGIRGIRFLKELRKGTVGQLYLNDASKEAVASIKRNLKANSIPTKGVQVENKEASLFLLENKPFDYIDIDPFGTPVGFLDASAKVIIHNGILAITATDTAALAGSAPRACLRKYWALPLRNFLMHEIGLRILARRVQLVAASYEKALFPVFSYAKLHYSRIFFRCSTKAADVDRILHGHQDIFYCESCTSVIAASQQPRCTTGCGSDKNLHRAGPLWTGPLFDAALAGSMLAKNTNEQNNRFLEIIKEEAATPQVGFYDTGELCQRLKVSAPPIEAVIAALHRQGSKASRTHLCGTGLRTDAKAAAVSQILSSQASS